MIGERRSQQHRVQSMESQDLSPHHADPSRPSLGFPLGTALLLIVIFSLSGIFSCCYHWDKLRSLRQSFSHDLDLEADLHSPPTKSKLSLSDSKQRESPSLSVLMPGDQIPKFIALPSPRELAQPEMVAEGEGKPPKPLRIWVPPY